MNSTVTERNNHNYAPKLFGRCMYRFYNITEKMQFLMIFRKEKSFFFVEFQHGKRTLSSSLLFLWCA